MNMKKIFKNILLSALMITAVASCADDRNNFLPDDSFGFNNKAGENVFTLPLYGGSYDIAVIKSGKGLNEGVVNITTSNFDLNNYNKQYGVEFIPLPADQDLYSFSTESIAFGTDDVTKSFTVSWDIAKVAAFMEEEPANQYCIPVALRSDELEVNDGRQVFILNLVTSTVTAEQTLLSRTYEWESEPASETMDITVRIDKAIPGIDLTVDFEVDETLVAAYNEANGTDYELAPQGLVTIGADPVIKAGTGYVLLPVTINTEALAEDMEVEVDGATETKKLVKRDWNGYVVPIKISGMSVDGVKVKNALTYVVVKGLEPIPPQLFTRLWGIYATSSTAPWQATFGVSDSRNITMDDQYVYVPQNAGGDAVLKAVSITDPSVVKNVNVQGISGGTHTLSCVRMVPNTDPAINGGKDILLACSLETGGNIVYYYAWLNGIDNAPNKYAVSSAGRRLGDKFSVYGVWGNGEIYLNDYSKGATIRHGMTQAEGIGEWYSGGANGWARGALNYDTGDDYLGCIAGTYMYPGTPALGSGVPSYLFVSSTSYGRFYNQKEGNTYTLAADLDLAMTHGYNFFSDAKTGAKYISYVSIASDQSQGSVKVVSDFNGTPEGLMGVLQNQKVVFEAPVQDGMDATVVSPCPATHSAGDCVVRTVGDETYMAVMIQNVGISVFKLNAGFVAE